MKALSDAQNEQASTQVKAADQKNEQDLADKKLASELVIHNADQAKINAEAGLAARKQGLAEKTAAAEHGLARQKAASEHTLAHGEHHLELRKHGLDAATAAHEAAMDV